jgi:methionyl-tRNA formyltransferase
MTAGELHDALMPLGAELARETCQMLASGAITSVHQNDIEATKAPKIFRNDCHINWNNSARNVRNFIHGMSPHPGAWTLQADGKTLKILRSSIVQDSSLSAGEYAIIDSTWLVGCADGALALTEIQPEGKRAMNTSDFLHGYRGALKGVFA